MISNLERYKKDLAELIDRGQSLITALAYKVNKSEVEKVLNHKHGDDIAAKLIKVLPDFDRTYQAWYSEAKSLIRQLLPDRLDDFCRHYEKPKTRKNIDYENYCIEDCLQSLSVTRTKSYLETEKVVGPDAALPRLQQQVAIVRSAKGRFESSLFDIRQLLQADLFDSEIEAAKHLLKNKFARAAGAMGGVVLEKHLGEVCQSHNVKITKKDPSIADLNEALKGAGVIDIAQWRFVQHLGDIRNKCDHDKKVEPTPNEVQDLLDGISKVTKTIN